MDTFIKLLAGINGVLKELSSHKVGLLIILIITGIFGYFTFENRQSIFSAIIQSPLFLAGSIVGVVVIVIGVIFKALITRYDESNEAIINLQREQIDKLSQDAFFAQQREREMSDKFNTLLFALREKSE